MEQITKQFYYKKNRLQQIKGFCCTVQGGSMVEAAKKMGLTPSTISLQIQSLERDLGTKLFERNFKKIKLTAEGQMLYSHALFYVHGIDNLFRNFTKLTTSKKNEIIISINNNMSTCSLLPEYVQLFEKLHPEAKFQIKNLVKSEAINRLKNDQIDILIEGI